MRFNIPFPDVDVLSEAVFEPSFRKKVDEDYWKAQDKIMAEVFQ